MGFFRHLLREESKPARFLESHFTRLESKEDVMSFINSLWHPRTGTGQVEHLKHFRFEDTWSRRINKQYRMIYEIHDLEVYVSIVSLRSHYGDK